MITSQQVGPDEALKLGIVNRLTPADALLDETEAYARQLAAGATLAIGAIKQAVYEGIEMDLEDALTLERELAEPLFDSEDAQEGFAAFSEKRQPVYKGR
jgi:enoyl-CoA hydratase/carnithine racemase